MVLNMDIAPTVLELAGATAAEGDARAQRGAVRSHPTARRLPPEMVPRDAWYYEYFEFPDVSHNVNKHRGVRTTKWKFIHYYDPPFKFREEFELYDLEKDPEERVNLANRPAHAGDREGTASEDGAAPQGHRCRRREVRSTVSDSRRTEPRSAVDPSGRHAPVTARPPAAAKRTEARHPGAGRARASAGSARLRRPSGTGSARYWPAAGWAWCTGRKTSRSAATWRSRCSARNSPGTSAAGRFREEAQITGQLQHPASRRFTTSARFPDGRPFLAMKLIKGRTLADEIEDPTRPGDASTVPRACSSRCARRSRSRTRSGVIHRDLKPANVMVGAFGEVQVMDWGLAKFVARGEAAAKRPRRTGRDAGRVSTPDSHVGPEDRTEVGEVLGTPAYMPPEQARGEEVDERADVFALGGILCAILTGKPPYTGNVGTRGLGESVARCDRRRDVPAERGHRVRGDSARSPGAVFNRTRPSGSPTPGEVAAAVHAAAPRPAKSPAGTNSSCATEDADRLERRAALRAG